MALTLDKLSFNPLRSLTSRRNKSWSRLILSFKDSDSDCLPAMELTLLQTSNPDTTIASIEREATDRAKTILRAALDALEANDVTSLLENQEAEEERRRKERGW